MGSVAALGIVVSGDARPARPSPGDTAPGDAAAAAPAPANDASGERGGVAGAAVLDADDVNLRTKGMKEVHTRQQQHASQEGLEWTVVVCRCSTVAASVCTRSNFWDDGSSRSDAYIRNSQPNIMSLGVPRPAQVALP